MTTARSELTRVRGSDLLIALAVATIQVAGTVVLPWFADESSRLDLVGGVLLALSALPLVYRDAHPTAALLAVGVVGVAYTWLGYPGAMYTVSLVIALWAAVSAGRRLEGIVVSVALVANLVVADLAGATGHAQEPDSPIWLAAWLGAGIALGEMSRGRRQLLEHLEQRAIDAERTREEEARRRAGEERLRIARELHDVLAHNISLINVQAGVAVHLLDKQPEQARTALVTISHASKEALRELRATLGVLRQVDEAEPLTPTPGLGRLDDLLERASAAGVSVRLERVGEPRDLPAATDLAAYRIIQEALTNVARHSGAREANVAIRYDSDAVEISIEDEGAGLPDDASSLPEGNGLTGMRERATATGGSLEAGPREDGGFRVRARLPLGEPA